MRGDSFLYLVTPFLLRQSDLLELYIGMKEVGAYVHYHDYT